jgi:hypothetical protein
VSSTAALWLQPSRAPRCAAVEQRGLTTTTSR